MTHFEAGTLASIYDGIRGGITTTLKQIEKFVKEVNYEDNDFWSTTEIILGSVKPAERFDAAMLVNKNTPRDMLANPAILTYALDCVDLLPPNRQKAALTEIAYRAPFESALREEASERLNGQRKQREQTGMSLRDFVASIHSTPSALRFA